MAATKAKRRTRHTRTDAGAHGGAVAPVAVSAGVTPIRRPLPEPLSREEQTPAEVLAAVLLSAAAVIVGQPRNDEEGALGVLAVVDALGPVVDSWRAWWAAEAHELGASWADVGAVLGVTRQTAWTRFGGQS